MRKEQCEQVPAEYSEGHSLYKIGGCHWGLFWHFTAKRICFPRTSCGNAASAIMKGHPAVKLSTRKRELGANRAPWEKGTTIFCLRQYIFKSFLICELCMCQSAKLSSWPISAMPCHSIKFLLTPRCCLLDRGWWVRSPKNKGCLHFRKWEKEGVLRIRTSASLRCDLTSCLMMCDSQRSGPDQITGYFHACDVNTLSKKSVWKGHEIRYSQFCLEQAGCLNEYTCVCMHAAWKSPKACLMILENTRAFCVWKLMTWVDAKACVWR